MSEQETCPSGRSGCDFAETHELALAGKILRMIESYSQDNRTYPCPECLRNSIMAIAALLHLQTATEDRADPRQIHANGAVFAESFAEAARERMLTIMDAVTDFDTMLGKRQLM